MLKKEEVMAIFKAEFESNKDIEDPAERHKQSVKGARSRIHWTLQATLTDAELSKLNYEQGKTLWDLTEKIISQTGLHEDHPNEDQV